jgi:hypothetical protein
MANSSGEAGYAEGQQAEKEAERLAKEDTKAKKAPKTTLISCKELQTFDKSL